MIVKGGFVHVAFALIKRITINVTFFLFSASRTNSVIFFNLGHFMYFYSKHLYFISVEKTPTSASDE